MNKAFSVILNSENSLMGAGRTDTGVHAKEMYAHFDFETPIDTTNLIHKLNSFLPKDIVIYRYFSSCMMMPTLALMRQKERMNTTSILSNMLSSGTKLVLSSKTGFRFNE